MGSIDADNSSTSTAKPARSDRPDRFADPRSSPLDRPRTAPENAAMPSFETVATTSRDVNLLYNAALTAAASTDAAEHQALRKQLNTPAFIDLLDTPEDYEAPPKTLRIAGVIKELMNNRSPVSDATLNSLAINEFFVSIIPRQNLMILAMVPVRPASREAVTLWRNHSSPQAAFRHVAMNAMADNGTAPAMVRFEEVFADPAHDQDEKTQWLRDALLRNRDKPEVLLAAERMVTKSLPQPLRPTLVSALFDYRPEWYLSCDPPKAPSLAATTRPAKDTLRRIGEYALEHVQLDARTNAAVKATLQTLPKPSP
jgi:hypothetical protein